MQFICDLMSVKIVMIVMILADQLHCYIIHFRDHRKVLVGDSRGRIYSWSLSDAVGGLFLFKVERIHLFIFRYLFFSG